MRRNRSLPLGLCLVLGLPAACLDAAPHRRRVHPNSSLTILSMIGGPDGFLWLATADGLHRFDGFHYQKIREYPLGSARKTAVTQDGSVWIGGAQGLVRYRDGKFQPILSQNVLELVALPDRVLVKVLAKPPDRGDRVMRLDGSVDRRLIPGNIYYTVEPSGALWAVAIRESRAVRIDPDRPGEELAALSLPGTFEQVMRDAAGRLWAADGTRAIELKNGRQVQELTRRHSQRTQRSYPLLAGRHGQAWFVGETIVGLEPRVEFRDLPLHDQYQPTAAYEDERGHLWVAKLGLGLVEWIPDPQWQRWPADDLAGLPAAQVSRTPGGLALATHRNIYRLDPGGVWRAIARESREYAALLPLEDGGFLAAVRRLGLVRLNALGEIAERPANPLPSGDDYRLLIRDGQGRVWAGNKRVLFEVMGRPGSLRLRREDPPGASNEENAQAIDMELDAAGNLWLGYAKGVARRDGQGAWRQIPTDVPVNEVRSFTLADREKGEEIWLAYRHSGPFARLQKRGERWQVTHFAASAGYGPEDTHFIKRDSRGWIWRGSPDGVHISDGVHVAPQDWLHFSPGNGLGTRSTDQYGFFEDRDGAVWISGEDGVTRIMPDPAWFRAASARPRVTRVEVDGVETTVEPAVRLPSGKRTVRIELGTLAASGMRDYPLRYRVRPRDEEWRHSRNGTVEVAAPADGSYMLEAGLTGATEVMAFPFAVGSEATGISWLWLFPAPVAGGMLALLGPWFPWSERVRYRLRKSLFVLHRRFTRQESSGGPRDQAPDYSGRILCDRYRLLRAVSRGGFSVVYEAEDLKLEGGKVAVKVLNASSANEGWLRDRFAHEVAALRSVDHRAVVRILDSWVSPEGEPCLAMPLLEGPTLREALKQGPLAPRRAAVVVREMGAALGEVHAKGVVHRDLKPENVILTGDGAVQPVVIDFGTASLRGRQDELAATTMLSGSFHYMAPERLSGHYSAESDVYSFAAIVLEVVTGKRLSDLRVLFSDDSFRPQLVETARATLPPDVAAALAEELAKAYDPRPQRRPADVRAWSAEIAGLLERA